jgi:hypothetical protein
VRRLESGEWFGPGDVGDAVAAYARFLRRPGRVLYVPYEDCPCCDPIWARDRLQEAIDALPSPAARELRRLVERLDGEFERRTLADPLTPRTGDRRAWWHCRIYERT